MGVIRVREGDGIVSIYDLDNCGVPLVGSSRRLSITEVSEVGWEDVIDEGDQVVERNFGGRKCYTDSGADELQHVRVDLTTCGVIPALDTLLMASNPITDSGAIVGYGRRDLDSTSAVLVEVLIELDASDCTGGGDIPVFGILFPLVKNWKPSGGSTLNGSNLLRPQFQGKCFQNANLAGDLPAELGHWSPVWSVDDWYTVATFSNGEVVLDDIVTSGELQSTTAGS